MTAGLSLAAAMTTRSSGEGIARMVTGGLTGRCRFTDRTLTGSFPDVAAVIRRIFGGQKNLTRLRGKASVFQDGVFSICFLAKNRAVNWYKITSENPQNSELRSISSKKYSPAA